MKGFSVHRRCNLIDWLLPSKHLLLPFVVDFGMAKGGKGGGGGCEVGEVNLGRWGELRT